MKDFKFYGGKKVKNTIEYIKKYLKDNPDTKIIVGTDSEQYSNYTNYVTVICLVKPTKGAHIIYSENKEKKIYDIFSKLWNEVEFTRNVADEIEKSINNNSNKKMVTVHLDVNKKKNAKSNIVHDSAVGYLKGLGYSVETKPNSWVATKAADWLC